jgi:uncharacterized membrane protein YbaN (DUF454 family)
MHIHRKWIYWIAGMGLVGLAAIGILLPLLPTTPFLLLAAACFARSSDRWHRWLLEHRIFGPIIRNWHTNRCIPRRAKAVAVAMMLFFGGTAVGFALENMQLRIAGSIVLLIGLIFVLRLPTCPPPR